jgi:hypothetical protein
MTTMPVGVAVAVGVGVIVGVSVGHRGMCGRPRQSRAAPSE